jgi:hypothetical protein
VIEGFSEKFLRIKISVTTPVYCLFIPGDLGADSVIIRAAP